MFKQFLVSSICCVEAPLKAWLIESLVTKLFVFNDSLSLPTKVPKKLKEKMSELYFAKRAKQGWKGEGKAKVKENVSMIGNKLKDSMKKFILKNYINLNLYNFIIINEYKMFWK